MSQYDRQISNWLLCVCAAIFIMLIIGGATRLTHSGLSMVEWDPLMGWIPPVNDTEWNETFEKYQQSPEYQKLNADMNVEGFKSIFMFEYVHRVWGRLIGMVFLLPMLFFLFAGRVKRSLRPKLMMMFIFGGLQGVMGWYMVKSGLADNPYVSQYRLTAHLLLAFLVYGYIFWIAMSLRYPHVCQQNKTYSLLKKLTLCLSAWIVLTIASGGFVAGLKAGFAFNTFPLMDGSFVPDHYWLLEPWYLNFFDAIASVQFDHRILAESTLIFVIALFVFSKRHQLSRRAEKAFHALMGMAVLQVILGISTLVMAVPVVLGVAHQAGAMILFSFALFVGHALRYGESEESAVSS
ncbi:MAG: COX15/CtaA family protein [Mariprofundaceae bacterium]|nr:COX15/CtaA family protein [Mariprofundaceae bacterium]